MTHDAINPITVEVIGSALSSIVEEMGEALIRASHSTNIKERKDCSVALFDARGRLVAQASHIPLHLGSLDGSVRAVVSMYAAWGRDGYYPGPSYDTVLTRKQPWEDYQRRPGEPRFAEVPDPMQD